MTLEERVAVAVFHEICVALPAVDYDTAEQVGRATASRLGAATDRQTIAEWRKEHDR